MSVVSPFPSLRSPSKPQQLSFFSPLKPESKKICFKSSTESIHLQNPNRKTAKSSLPSNVSAHENPILSNDWAQLVQISIGSGDFLLGLSVHAFLVKSGSQNDTFQSNNLINLYVKFGRLRDARKLFDEMSVRNKITWTTLINGYSQIDDIESVFRVASEMHRSGEIFSEHTCTAVLGSCHGSLKYQIRGEQIHALVIKSGFEMNVFVGTSLVSMYSRSGSLDDAEMVFEDLVDIDIRCSNSMILGYSKIGDVRNALSVFRDLLASGLEPNDYTFTNVISACDGANGLDVGLQLHGLAFKYGVVGEVSVGNAIITMYGKHELVKEAERMFYGMNERNLVSWTAILSAYVKKGNSEKAIDGFVEMLGLGVCFDSSCLATVVDACSKCRNPEWVLQIHGLVIKLCYHSNAYVGTALIDNYAKLHNLESAKRVFDGLSDQNIASFNALLGGYRQISGHEEENIMVMFNELRLTGIEPDSATLAQFLSLSADQASIVKGMCLHAYAMKAGFEDDITVGNAVITMYAKCGSIEDACWMFRNMVSHDTVTWNAMVSAYALHGQGKEALLLFEKMDREGYVPDEITLMAVLQACSYSGLYEDGFRIFNNMEKRYGIELAIEHQACMVDLLGRAGRLSEAMEFVKGSQFATSPLLWRTLVNACKLHGDLNLGRLASKSLLDLAPDDAASYILVSNMYASGGMLEESAKVRVMMNEKMVKKDAGCSWIEIDNRVHRFVANAKDHVESREIYMKLEKLSNEMKDRGYVSTVNLLLQDL
ncbi:pentatricopeptide repeat-containing protein At2g33680-like [Magnolia sinica]|uniref:pentatricopeptide repeat-containing protein At2g33680-like n=1 Tax=Magnolia sinica TaxID=86752 RepID=UPI002659620A|nr:pentatricopeptide repeat-containing protein At2g33680-like [Magnolia sinica]